MDDQREDRAGDQVEDGREDRRDDRRDDDRTRPIPSATSMLAVGGGLLVAAGLVAVLAELDSFDQRGPALAISVLFLVMGLAVSAINRSSRAAAAGVAISAFAVVPLTIYLYANADIFGELSGGEVEGNPFDGLRGVVTLMLGTAALLWLAGYLLGPVRRFGFYLGAALLALWLIPVATMQISALEDTFRSFESSSTFEPVPIDPDLDSDFGSDFDSDFGSDFDSEFDSDFDRDFELEEPEIADPSTKLGVVSLVFGAAYLGVAAWRDRRGDQRTATAVLVPALIVLLYAVSLLTGHIGWVGIGVLGMAVGGAIVAVGLRGGRRASSWIGTAVATVAFASLVVQGLRDSARATGAVLTVAGVVLALLAGRAEGRTTAPEDGPGPEGPGSPSDPFATTPTPEAAPSPASPWATAATGAPTFTAPVAPPASPPHPPTEPPSGPPAEPSPWSRPS